ncbi:Rv3654c family TadE-like protein [Nocardioides sp. Root190]|uniref:Rv3654c family TadE-like protein n=1 Tax=Nocardioides sp. Root190 TaxID=1736488 RepID=UPI000ABEF99C|nr:Rv3654c family TadE-like protein [Nocardioides sp. Root190]
MSARGAREDRGAATVLAVAMAGVLLLVGAAASVVGAIVVAHRSAQAAADLAALAGASVAADATGDPCAAAATIAGRNGAEVRSCAITHGTVEVEVVVPGPRWLGQDQDLSARARAGPGG